MILRFCRLFFFFALFFTNSSSWAATVTIALGNLTQTYDGTAKVATVTTTPAGIPVRITYGDLTGAPIGAGVYSVVAVVDDPAFEGSTQGVLTIERAAQSVRFGTSDIRKTYGDADFKPGAVSSISLPLSYSSDNPEVAAVTPEGLIRIVGAGTARITATQAGTDNYNAASATEVLDVAKAPLMISANSATKSYGSDNPALTANYQGFVAGDSVSALGGAASLSCSATAAAPVGSYPIAVGAGSLTSRNYAFSFVPGTLEVVPAVLAIDFKAVPGPSEAAGITWSAAVSGATGPFEYQFFEHVDGRWVVVQPYSTKPFWSWDPRGKTGGDHYFTVYARVIGSVQLYDLAQFGAYYLVPPAATAVTLTSSPAGPQVAGTEIVFSAAAMGGGGEYEYQFYQHSNGQWVVVQPYSTNSSWRWSDNQSSVGDNYFTVYARSVGSKAGYDVAQFGAYKLTAPQASGVTVTPDLPSPQTAGTSVVFTAQATGGTGQFEYQFYQFTGGTWVVVQPYSQADSWRWNGNNSISENYFTVYARSVGSGALYDVSQFFSYSVAPAPATSVTFTAAPVGPQRPGTDITFTAAAAGGSGEYEYQFYQQVAGKWVVVQPYAAEPTFHWHPDATNLGDNYFTVYARSVGSKHLYDTAVFGAYLVLPKAATSVNLVSSPSGATVRGAGVAFTAAATGGSGDYEYLFYHYQDGHWIVVQPYSAEASWHWDTSDAALGTHYVTVYVRSKGSAEPYEVAQFLAYTITPPPATGVAMVAAPASPQLAGPLVTLTATATGGPGPYEYQFYQQIKGQWVVVQPYSADPSWTWDTTGAAPGTHYFTVYARAVGSAACYEVSDFQAYTILSKPSWQRVLSEAPWTPRDSAGAFVFQDKMWLVGGYTPDLVADVWSSPDGINWQKDAEEACPGGINVPIHGVLGDKLQIFSNTGAFCSSADGATWSVVPDVPPFGVRYASGHVVFKDRLWVLGGLIVGGKLTNDVWSSRDGVNWTLELPQAPWSPRSLYGNVLVYQDKLWVFGGGIVSSTPRSSRSTTSGTRWMASTGPRSRAPPLGRYVFGAAQRSIGTGSGFSVASATKPIAKTSTTCGIPGTALPGNGTTAICNGPRGTRSRRMSSVASCGQ